MSADRQRRRCVTCGALVHWSVAIMAYITSAGRTCPTTGHDHIEADR